MKTENSTIASQQLIDFSSRGIEVLKRRMESGQSGPDDLWRLARLYNQRDDPEKKTTLKDARIRRLHTSSNKEAVLLDIEELISFKNRLDALNSFIADLNSPYLAEGLSWHETGRRKFLKSSYDMAIAHHKLASIYLLSGIESPVMVREVRKARGYDPDSSATANLYITTNHRQILKYKNEPDIRDILIEQTDRNIETILEKNEDDISILFDVISYYRNTGKDDNKISDIYGMVLDCTTLSHGSAYDIFNSYNLLIESFSSASGSLDIEHVHRTQAIAKRILDLFYSEDIITGEEYEQHSRQMAEMVTINMDSASRRETALDSQDQAASDMDYGPNILKDGKLEQIVSDFEHCLSWYDQDHSAGLLRGMEIMASALYASSEEDPDNLALVGEYYLKVVDLPFFSYDIFQEALALDPYHPEANYGAMMASVAILDYDEMDEGLLDDEEHQAYYRSALGYAKHVLNHHQEIGDPSDGRCKAEALINTLDLYAGYVRSGHRLVDAALPKYLKMFQDGEVKDPFLLERSVLYMQEGSDMHERSLELLNNLCWNYIRETNALIAEKGTAAAELRHSDAEVKDLIREINAGTV